MHIIFINYVHDYTFIPIENIKSCKENGKTITASEGFYPMKAMLWQ